MNYWYFLCFISWGGGAADLFISDISYVFFVVGGGGGGAANLSITGIFYILCVFGNSSNSKLWGGEAYWAMAKLANSSISKHLGGGRRQAGSWQSSQILRIRSFWGGGRLGHGKARKFFEF